MSVSSSFCVNAALGCSSVLLLLLLPCKSVTLVCRDFSLFFVVAVVVAFAWEMLQLLSCNTFAQACCVFRVGPFAIWNVSCIWGG
jgi:hypothetical protein